MSQSQERWFGPDKEKAEEEAASGFTVGLPRTGQKTEENGTKTTIETRETHKA